MRTPSNGPLNAVKWNDSSGRLWLKVWVRVFPKAHRAGPGAVPLRAVVEARESAVRFSALPTEACGRFTGSSNIVLMNVIVSRYLVVKGEPGGRTFEASAPVAPVFKSGSRGPSRLL